MVYSEVPNFSEPNLELLAQANMQNKTVCNTLKMMILQFCFVFFSTQLSLYSHVHKL